MECKYVGSVGGGFPSPAEGWRERSLEISEVLQEHPESTFFMVVRGNSMDEAGIGDGDPVVVDRALKAEPGSIIIALLNGGFVVKRYLVENGKVVLASAHPRFPPLPVTSRMTFEVWGVVSFVVKSVRVGHAQTLRARLAQVSRRGEQ
ncbi:LexA family protein [Ktedonospora formicarum]|uniref:Peptidase S24/S26A/S26B/S26C domain-containing protein n=1 Tax=Ktedonospora formicarum TaxID=2778364 RepID=A0A8J3I7M5_9CHLR|nr:translesion error-prone DNA polymerase V autoproteolytic subunit [Ktedonospora formicarum]GHO48345.1 hypothetical protein KSX_65080 [Ktedonospora formicarum]